MLLVAAILFATCSLLSASRLPIKTYTTADGLPRDHILCIVQDSRGFIWFCTAEGLSRFDGYQFANYRTEQGLPSNFIEDFIETRQGTYWVATSGGLCRFEPSGAGPSRFHCLPVTGSNAVPGPSELFADREGGVWVSGDGIFHLGPKDHTFQRIELTVAPKTTFTATIVDRRGTLWVGTSNGLYRRDPNGTTRIYSMADGLSNDYIMALVEDREGHLWIGTRKGLIRIDGVPPPGKPLDPLPRLRVFTPEDGLPASRIESLLITSAGKLWVGTTDGIAERSAVKSGAGREFRSYTLAQGLSARAIGALTEDRDGNLWMGTFGSGAMKLAHSGFLTYLETDGAPFARALMESRQGEMCALSRNESDLTISRFDGNSFLPIRPHWPHDITYFGWGRGSIAVESQCGDWWIATGQGLVRFPPVKSLEQLASVRPKAVYTTRDGLPGDGIFQIFEDSRGDIWIGTIGPNTEDGLALWCHSSGKIVAFTEAQSPRAAALTGGQIQQTRPGNASPSCAGISKSQSPHATALKVGQTQQTRPGNVDLISASTSDAQRPFDKALPVGPTQQTRPGQVSPFCADIAGAESPHATALKVGQTQQTRPGNVDLISASTSDAQRPFDTAPPVRQTQQTRPGQVSPFCADITGAQRPRFGLTTVGQTQRTFLQSASPFCASISDAQRPPAPAPTVGQPQQTRPGQVGPFRTEITGAQRPRAARLTAGQTQQPLSQAVSPCANTPTTAGLPRSPVPTAFAEDRTGSVWIGLFHGGLACYRPATARFTTFTSAEGIAGVVRALFTDSAGRLWIGTTRGLVRLDDPSQEHPHFIVYTIADGLSSNFIAALTEDRAGRIYAATGRGVDRFIPSPAGLGRIRQFTMADGIAPGELDIAFRDKGGALWFTTPLGISRFVISGDEPRAPPPVLFTGLDVGGIPHRISELGQTSISGLRLKPSSLRIDFVGLDFSPGEKLRYEYMLEGADHDWNCPTDQRTVVYASLASGAYRFLVRAVASDGTVSPQPATFSFTILPPIWRAWWFLSLCGLAISLLIFALHRYRLAQVLALANVRTRIATDLHDDIGASLSQIAILSEVAQRTAGNDEARTRIALTGIAGISRELVDSMSDIVWAINPDHDRVTNLVYRMRRFASDLLDSRKIALQFRSTIAEQDLKIGAEARRQVYLVFKEAIHNIVRHSGADRVEVDLEYVEDTLKLKLHDNGKGFDPALGYEGRGLVNMRNRTAGLAGTLEFQSSPGSTTLRLTAPLNRRRPWQS